MRRTFVPPKNQIEDNYEKYAVESAILLLITETTRQRGSYSVRPSEWGNICSLLSELVKHLKFQASINKISHNYDKI